MNHTALAASLKELHSQYKALWRSISEQHGMTEARPYELIISRLYATLAIANNPASVPDAAIAGQLIAEAERHFMAFYDKARNGCNMPLAETYREIYMGLRDLEFAAMGLD